MISRFHGSLGFLDLQVSWISRFYGSPGFMDLQFSQISRFLGTLGLMEIGSSGFKKTRFHRTPGFIEL